MGLRRLFVESLSRLFVELLINQKGRYPANLAGAPGALIFFCIFSSIKGRKDDPKA